MNEVRPSPCRYCPYRKDVPSGLWAASEYERLADYDRPTCEQPLVQFGCHEQNGLLCSGWAQCHNNRGHAFQLLALRLIQRHVHIPKRTVALFKSGTEAAKHGLRDILKPGFAARIGIRYLNRLHKLKAKLKRKTNR